ncbi:hypothetical protein [Robertkochia solimangrovi]|uniref:hypothetical protein n=1 Tax=Robertkochia solimangrovi TaxID=2213046 RepID=UPI00117DAF64|nr:hypothetical protein [Robertkochia solimangrovi]TRZ45251.1 hypothetical protein DMZ48_05755 [Robertkochia solimangrovi]
MKTIIYLLILLMTAALNYTLKITDCSESELVKTEAINNSSQVCPIEPQRTGCEISCLKREITCS